jgi:hypothetical protein
MTKYSKIAILLLILLIFVIVVLLILVALVKTESKEPGVSYPLSNPISYNEDNIVEVDEEQLENYKYTVITETDIIKLFDKQGEELIINLDYKNWHSISWSPDGKLIAVLGKESNSSAYNLYIYDLRKRAWRVATNFEQGSGVESYVWKNNDTILFIEGEAANKWLQSYKYSTVAEIRKLNRVEGQLLEVSSDEAKLLVKKEKANGNFDFSFYTSVGEYIYSLNDLKTKDDELINPLTAMFTSDPDKVVLSDETKLYKHQFGSTELFVIAESGDLRPLCALSEDNILTAKFGEEYLDLLNTDIKEQSSENITSINTFGLGELDQILVKCFDSINFLIPLSLPDSIKWYSKQIDGGVTDFEFFKNAKEVTAKED